MSANMKELFGSSDEEGDDEQQERQQQTRAGSASPRRQQEDEALEDDLGDEDAPAKQQQQQRTQAAAASSDDDAGGSDQERVGDRDRYKKPPRAIAPPMDIDAPLAPLPAPNSIHLLRQSNIIDVEPRPFDPATFEPEQVRAWAAVHAAQCRACACWLGYSAQRCMHGCMGVLRHAARCALLGARCSSSCCLHHAWWQALAACRGGLSGLLQGSIQGTAAYKGALPGAAVCW